MITDVSQISLEQMGDILSIGTLNYKTTLFGEIESKIVTLVCFNYKTQNKAFSGDQGQIATAKTEIQFTLAALVEGTGFAEFFQLLTTSKNGKIFTITHLTHTDQAEGETRVMETIKLSEVYGVQYNLSLSMNQRAMCIFFGYAKKMEQTFQPDSKNGNFEKKIETGIFVSSDK